MPDESENKTRNKSNDKMRTNNIIRYVFVALIVVPCFIVAGMIIFHDEFEVPWSAVVFYGFGLLAIYLLLVSPTQVSTLKDEKDVYLSARKQLVDWMKMQGVVITIFFSIAGFYVVKEVARDAARDAVEPHVKDELKNAENTYENAKKRYDSINKNIADANDRLDKQMKYTKTRLIDFVQQAENAKTNAINAGKNATSRLEEVKNSSQKMLNQVTKIAKVADDTLSLVKEQTDTIIADANDKLLAYEKRADEEIEKNNIAWNKKLSEAEQKLNDKISDVENQTRRFLLVAAEGAFGSLETPNLVDLLDKRSKDPKAIPEHLEALITILYDRDDIEKKQDYTRSLIAVIDSKHKHARGLAVRALGRVGGKDAINKSMLTLHDSDPYIRQEATGILIQETDYDGFMIEQELVDKIVQALSAALADSKLKERYVFANALGDLGPSAKAAIPLLVEAMKDDQIRLRQSAAVALTKIDPDSDIVVPDLVKFLRSSEWPVDRFALLDALKRLGPNAKSAVRSLIEILETRSLGSFERQEFMGALGRIGDPSAAPFLTEALKNKDSDIWGPALSALESLAMDKTILVDILAQQLQNTLSSDKFPRIVKSLSKLGMSAKVAVPDLVKILNDPNTAGDLRRQVASALGRIATPEAHTALVDALDNSDSEIVLASLEALSVAGNKTDEIVSRSIELLQDPNFPHKSDVAKILGSVGPAAKPAIPELLTLVSESSHAYSAAEALGRIGDPSVVDDLLSILESPDEDEKGFIAGALARLDDDKAAKAVINSIRNVDYTDDEFSFVSFDVEEGIFSPALMKELLSILDDDSLGAQIRTAMAYYLAELGVDADSVSARLIRIVRSSEKDYLRAAIAYLLAKSDINDVVPDAIDLYRKVVDESLKELNGGYENETMATWEFIWRTLYEYGPQASEAGPMLISTLENEAVESEIREHTIEILGRTRYKEALEFLDELIRQSGGEGFEEIILIAMWRIKGRTIDELVQDLNDEEGYFRVCAAEEIGRLGKKASSAVPHLINALSHGVRWELREKAAIALARIGIPSKEVITALECASRYDDNDDVRRAALNALKKLQKFSPD